MVDDNFVNKYPFRSSSILPPIKSLALSYNEPMVGFNSSVHHGPSSFSQIASINAAITAIIPFFFASLISSHFSSPNIVSPIAFNTSLAFSIILFLMTSIKEIIVPRTPSCWDDLVLSHSSFPKIVSPIIFNASLHFSSIKVLTSVKNVVTTPIGPDSLDSFSFFHFSLPKRFSPIMFTISSILFSTSLTIKSSIPRKISNGLIGAVPNSSKASVPADTLGINSPLNPLAIQLIIPPTTSIIAFQTLTAVSLNISNILMFPSAASEAFLIPSVRAKNAPTPAMTIPQLPSNSSMLLPSSPILNPAIARLSIRSIGRSS